MDALGLGHTRVLAVDDDASNRALIEVLLTSAGVGQVRLSAGDEPLLPVVAAFDPHVVLLDLHLGDQDGMELLQQIVAADQGEPRRRVVMVTGESSPAFLERALALGAADVLVKPYDPDRLTDLVHGLLRPAPVVVPVAARTELGDLRAVLEQAPEPYVLLEPDLVIVTMSEAYLEATGGRREDIVGRPLLDAFEHSASDEAWADVRRQAEAHFDRVRRDLAPDAMAVKPYDMRGPDGAFQTRWFSPASWPVLGPDGRLRWILHRLEDVTDFVRLREQSDLQRGRTEELEERTAHMEAEVYRRAQQIEEANRQLQAANAAKSEFLSRMSHELRTPLTSILGFGELLALGELPSPQASYAQAVLHAGRHLLELINEVLDLSRIEAGHLALSTESVAVESLVADVHELLQPVAATHGVALEGGPWRAGKGYVRADRQRLRQVLINLAGNAIKYNHPGGRVWVTVEEVPGDRVRLNVHDTGPGLSEQDQGRLFRPFERLGAASTGVEGTGLGLALSQELAEAMGGQLGVTSEVGIGSTFWVELPVAEPAAVQDGAVEAVHLRVRGYSRSYTILYVEDLVANVQLVESILMWRPDIRLIPAMLGGVALDLAREHRPDLVLLDLHLPDMGGQEVLARLREDAATAQVPVVVFSADATARLAEELAAAGAVGYLTKPIGVRALLDAVDGALGEL